ncbi:hypothetical protein, partial [Lacrimispora sp.]|uniref:hypothetical protein n=1 Tax=Lacrimispora sp. TaxID=2719234 RepID=UPI0028A7C05C
MAATKHFPKWSMVDGGIKIKIDLSRFDKQYQKAQYGLDGDVMTSMLPFMPMQQGSFVNVTRGASAAIQGSGQVYAAYGPAGRFLYEGKTMVSEITGSTWARLGVQKVLVSQYSGKTSAKESLVYNKTTHPDAQAHWFDAAKNKDGKT